MPIERFRELKDQRLHRSNHSHEKHQVEEEKEEEESLFSGILGQHDTDDDDDGGDDKENDGEKEGEESTSQGSLHPHSFSSRTETPCAADTSLLLKKKMMTTTTLPVNEKKFNSKRCLSSSHSSLSKEHHHHHHFIKRRRMKFKDKKRRHTATHHHTTFSLEHIMGYMGVLVRSRVQWVTSKVHDYLDKYPLLIQPKDLLRKFMRRTIPVSKRYIQLKKEAYQEQTLRKWSNDSLPHENFEEEDFHSISTIEPWTDSDDDYRRQGLISSTVGSSHVHKSGPHMVSSTNQLIRLQQHEHEFLLEGNSFGSSTAKDDHLKDEKLMKLESELNSLKEQIARLVSVQTPSFIGNAGFVTGMESHPMASMTPKEAPNRAIPPPPPPPPCISPRTPLTLSKKSYPHTTPVSLLSEEGGSVSPGFTMRDVLKDLPNVKLRKTRTLTPGGTLHFPASHSKIVNATAADIIAMALKKKFANTSINKSSFTPDSPHSPVVEQQQATGECRPDTMNNQVNSSYPLSPLKPSSSSTMATLGLEVSDTLPVTSHPQGSLNDSFTLGSEVAVQSPSHAHETPVVLAS